MKKHNTSRLLSGVTKLEKIFTQKQKLKNSLNPLTILTNIARKDHMKNHKDNYKRAKQKLMHLK